MARKSQNTSMRVLSARDAALLARVAMRSPNERYHQINKDVLRASPQTVEVLLALSDGKAAKVSTETAMAARELRSWSERQLPGKAVRPVKVSVKAPVR